MLTTVCPSSPKPQMTTGAATASARRAASASAAAAAAVASSARWAAAPGLNNRRLQRVQHHPDRPSYKPQRQGQQHTCTHSPSRALPLPSRRSAVPSHVLWGCERPALYLSKRRCREPSSLRAAGGTGPAYLQSQQPW